MKRKITLIELVSFEGIDETDNERIEDRYIAMKTAIFLSLFLKN
jgi:hypothetical protein